MSTNVKAAVARQVGGPLSIETLHLDDLRPDEARVRLVASGVCHTDAIVRDGVYPTPQPAVLGHEGAGIVEAVGDAVRSVQPGDHVILSTAHCGDCDSCKGGEPMYCDVLGPMNFGGRRTADGSTALRTEDGEEVSSHFFGQSSFATHANVSASSLVPIPSDVPLESVAFFGCGMQTGAGAILNELKPEAGSSVAVSGSGAVGLAAVMAARVAGATTIIATDLHDERLELAKELGATHGINPSKVDVVEEMKAITGGRGVNYILDTTAIPAVLQQLADALSIRGTLALVGAAEAGTEVPFEIGGSLLKGWTFKTIIEGSAVPQRFIPQLVELFQQGRFPADKLVKTYGLEDINQAFEDSASGATVKPVIVY